MGPKFRFFPRSLAPEPIRHKINRLGETVEEYYGSEFQVIPIKRFLFRALTYKHTNIQTYIHPKSKQYPRRLHYVLGVDNKNTKHEIKTTTKLVIGTFVNTNVHTQIE